jgi:hypothetical protein
MFKFDDKSLNKLAIEIAAKRMCVENVAKQVLVDPDVREDVKLGIRCIVQMQNINDTLSVCIANKYLLSGKDASVETLEYVYEYLQLVEVGIKQFAQTTPFVEYIEEEKQ